MGRKRKLHLGNTPIGGAAVKSRRLARSITSQYHVIQNERSLINQDNSLTDHERQTKLEALNEQMESIGGTNKYQQASIINTQHFKTSKWVAGTLHKMNRQGSSAQKLNVLEVGAINTQLQQYNWMNVRAIDLNSQNPSIEEMDFFNVHPEGLYDVVLCSMVLNCVDEPIRRGEMLARLSCQLVPESGVLFFVLPKRCIYSQCVGGVKHFTSLLNGLGLYELLPCRETPKLIFYILGNASHNTNTSTNIGTSISIGTSTSIGRDGKSEEVLKVDKKMKGKEKKNSNNKEKISARVKAAAATTATEVAWHERVRSNISKNMRNDVFLHFSRDFSNVPANKFAIALPNYLTDGLF